MLYGVGVVALPGTIVGLYVAYGPGNAMSRSARGFAVLVVIPALGVLGIVANLVLSNEMDREAEKFRRVLRVLCGRAGRFGYPFDLVVGRGGELVVAGAGAAAGWLGTWICG